MFLQWKIFVHPPSNSSVGWTKERIFLQRSFIHLFVHQLCLMNWFTNLFTIKCIRQYSSIYCPTALLDEPINGFLYRKVSSIYSSTGCNGWTDGLIFYNEKYSSIHRPTALLDEPMDGFLYRKVSSIYSSTGSVGWTDGPIFLQLKYSSKQLCSMNQWTDFCTEKFRPSIRPPAMLDELMDNLFTMKNIRPSTV